MTKKPDFVYVLFIKTTTEQLWNALLDPEMTKQFWGRHRNVSEWQINSAWEHQDYDNSATVDVSGKVLEIVPHKKLVLSWATPANEQTATNTSVVTFEMVPFLDTIQLTVSHRDLPEEAYNGIALGWAAVLSSLKSLLETGKPIESTTRRWVK